MLLVVLGVDSNVISDTDRPVDLLEDLVHLELKHFLRHGETEG